MAAFEYKALGADGKKTSGIINADDKKQARSQLKKKGLFPTEVKEQQSGKTTQGEGLNLEIDFAKFFQSVSKQELAEMTSQMETLVRTSVDIAETLEILADQTENNMLRLALVEIQDKVKKGNRTIYRHGRPP
jgi:general secretion pathway protein F